jgi:FkbM family methyltransferase
MEQHFRHAVVGCGSQIKRASLGRRNLELHRLGLKQTGWGITSASAHALNVQETSITYPPHGITSYAQNFEDVMLWRALWHVENGFYIDVGAFDPVVDSVSRAFYENGWRGFHVEPLHEYAEKLRQDRPDEKVFLCPLASEAGVIDFYELNGISTGIKNIAMDNSRSLNQKYKITKRNAITLYEIFEDAVNKEIHWMKIDVEGMEGEVLSGWRDHRARPWIVVVESTKPLESTQTWMGWDFELKSRDYIFAYFDGLNRYYVHKKHKVLVEQLMIQPNVFDNYLIYKKDG